MSAEDRLAALGRIDTALARIEAALEATGGKAEPRAEPSADRNEAGARELLEDLRVRHERLRQAVTLALGEIDGLLADPGLQAAE